MGDWDPQTLGEPLGDASREVLPIKEPLLTMLPLPAPPPLLLARLLLVSETLEDAEMHVEAVKEVTLVVVPHDVGAALAAALMLSEAVED